MMRQISRPADSGTDGRKGLARRSDRSRSRNRAGVADRWLAAAIFLLLFLVYNANGREIASYDSQPAKFATRELLQRGTITLNHVVGTTPQLLDRAPFVAAADGNYRSAYSPTPVLLAAGVAWPFYKLGILDIRAPLAPPLIAKLAAATLTAAAVALLFFTALRWVPRNRALWIALAVGTGTGYWSTVSQTLWQHESAALGMALAVWAFTRPTEHMDVRAAVLMGVGLGIAGTSRAQLTVAIAVLLLGMFARTRPRLAVLSGAIVAVFAAVLVFTNIRWFGHPLGAVPFLESLHPTVHATEGSFHLNVAGPAGLLVSPNRGLLVFSPVVLVALAGFPRAFQAGWSSPVWWCALAAVCQYLLYGSYTVWWGGHTYGPRYMLDVLPLLVPVAAVLVAALRTTSIMRATVTVALAWSVTVGATGAFCYPQERWNTDPVDIDRNHQRLWSWSDMQIVRGWKRGPSPTNFRLFNRASFRVPPPRAARPSGSPMQLVATELTISD